MKIQRTEKTPAPVTPKSTIESLEAGTVFKVGTKLYVKTDSNEAVRLTNGQLNTFDFDEVADEIVEGTFVYA